MNGGAGSAITPRRRPGGRRSRVGVLRHPPDAKANPKAISFRLTMPLALALAFAAGCDQGSTTAGGDLTTTIDTIGGVIRVTNTGTPPEWRLAPVVSIGPKSLKEEASPEEFGKVSSAAFGPDGTVFVADALNQEVRVFGLDGAHRRTFGRGGEGPGEFSGLYSLAWVGDRLLTLDPHLGRIGAFSAEGEWLGQWNIEGGVTGSPAFIRFYPVGPDEAFRFDFGSGGKSVFVGYGSRGETGDRLPWLTDPPRPSSPFPICEYEGGMSFFPNPFGAEFVQHPGSGGVMYTAMTDVYRIAIIRGDADTVRVIERTLPAEPISDEEWEAETEEFREFRAERPDVTCNPKSQTRPDEKPFIEQIFVGPDGKLWVEVIRTAGNRWEFFDPEGRLLGGVPAPARKERAAPAFGTDHLVTIRQDSLDLDHVEVWRIERARRP